MTANASFQAQIAQLLVLVNHLQLKAFNAPNRETLAFIIVNDTHKVFKYDRAYLWDMESSAPKMIAISGHHTVYKETEFSQKSQKLLTHLKEPDRPQQLSRESFSQENGFWDELYPSNDKMVYWIPIEIKGQLRLGLWIESPASKNNEIRNVEEELRFLASTLVPGYASAWERFDQNRYIKNLHRNRQFWLYGLLTLAVVLFAVPVPLRVAAPFEVVPQSPSVISAPLDGIIEKVAVKPGQRVAKGDLLFSYDKRVPEQELKTAQNQVAVAEAELQRSSTLGLSDPKSLSEVELLKLKLKKEQIALKIAETQASKLDVEAPEMGIVMIDNPEEWQGRPVHTGEKVLTLSDPTKTKLKIWIPEGDNVVIDKETAIKVNLHVFPERDYEATLDYIAFESKIGEGEVPAFQAEAHWKTPPEDIKLGLKGTAVLYGENVSLFYFLARKPWATFRRVTGF